MIAFFVTIIDGDCLYHKEVVLGDVCVDGDVGGSRCCWCCFALTVRWWLLVLGWELGCFRLLVLVVVMLNEELVVFWRGFDRFDDFLEEFWSVLEGFGVSIGGYVFEICVNGV